MPVESQVFEWNTKEWNSLQIPDPGSRKTSNCIQVYLHTLVDTSGFKAGCIEYWCEL